MVNIPAQDSQALFMEGSAFLSYSGPQLIRQGPLTLERAICLLAYSLKCQSHPETPSQDTPRVMFNQILERPVALPSWYIVLTITHMGEYFLVLNHILPLNHKKNLSLNS